MRFIVITTLTFLVSALLWVALIFYQMETPRYRLHWLSIAYAKKEKYASTIKQPKIAIVSGSNALYGFDSAELEAFWQKPVVNKAVTVAFGLNYMFERSKKSLSQGDIVLMPLEYSFYQENALLTNHYVNYILAYDTDYFFNLPLKDKATIFLRMDTTWAIQGILARYYASDLIKNYNLDNLNTRGDLTNNHSENITDELSGLINALQPDIYDSSNLSEHFKKEMENYLQWAKSQNICLIAIPPSYLYFKQYENAIFKELLTNIELYYQQRGIPYIGNPADYMYPLDNIYNTKYHLNNLGVQKHMNTLKNDLGNNLTQYCNFRDI